MEGSKAQSGPRSGQARFNSGNSVNSVKTVLLADDELIVRDVLSIMFERLGYEVIIADNGTTALQSFRKHTHRIDLVMFDLAMPGIRGEDFFRLIKELRPDIKTILITGSYSSDQIDQLKNEGVDHVVFKPFDLPKLRQVVENTING